MIGTDEERESRKSMLPAWLDNDNYKIKMGIIRYYLLLNSTILKFYNRKHEYEAVKK